MFDQLLLLRELEEEGFLVVNKTQAIPLKNNTVSDFDHPVNLNLARVRVHANDEVVYLGERFRRGHLKVPSDQDHI